MSTLFLKYRPQTFDDIVGQESIRKTLQNALKSERPSHAYMFSGSRGTGKTSTARIFAKGLICPNLNEGNPCGTCDMCRSVTDGSLVDVIEIDAASNRGIDQIRDLREKIHFSPTIAKRKVYIIDEVHMLTKESFNALLKTLEEPPDHAFFCLATTEIHKVPETILSRCQVFMFSRFTKNQMVERLSLIVKNEEFKAEKEALELIALKAEGGMRDAISLLEQVSVETEKNLTKENTQKSLGMSSSESLKALYTAIMSQDKEAGLELIMEKSRVGSDFRAFGHDFLQYLRTKMHENLNTPELSKIIEAIQVFEKALFNLKSTPIIELPFEIAIINLCQGVQKTTPAHPTPKTSTQPPHKTTSPQQSIPPNPAIPSENKAETVSPPPPPSAPKAPAPKIAEGNLPTPGQIKSQMEAIAAQASLPAFIKKSFFSTHAEQVDGKIVFYTDSEFHREKLNASATKLGLQKAINEVFSTTLEIDFVKRAKPATPKAESGPVQKNGNDDFLVF